MPVITDVLELLTVQHQEILELLSRVPVAIEEERPRVIGELADKLTTHLTAEEELFYPVVVDAVLVNALREEHAEIKRVVAALLGGAEDDAPLISSLALHVHDHVSWQENVLFERIAETVPAEVLSTVGAKLGAWSTRASCLAA